MSDKSDLFCQCDYFVVRAGIFKSKFPNVLYYCQLNFIILSCCIIIQIDVLRELRA
jgi:hypothetical protein